MDPSNDLLTFLWISHSQYVKTKFPNYGRTQMHSSGYPDPINIERASLEKRFGPAITAIVPGSNGGRASSTSSFCLSFFPSFSFTTHETASLVLYLKYSSSKEDKATSKSSSLLFTHITDTLWTLEEPDGSTALT